MDKENNQLTAIHPNILKNCDAQKMKMKSPRAARKRSVDCDHIISNCYESRAAHKHSESIQPLEPEALGKDTELNQTMELEKKLRIKEIGLENVEALDEKTDSQEEARESTEVSQGRNDETIVMMTSNKEEVDSGSSSTEPETGDELQEEVKEQAEEEDESSCDSTFSLAGKGVTQKKLQEEEDDEWRPEDEIERKKEQKQLMSSLRSSVEEQRYERLQLLLDRSETYATFLLERVQKQKKEKELKEEKQKKKQEQERLKREEETKLKLEEEKAKQEATIVENIDSTPSDVKTPRTRRKSKKYSPNSKSSSSQSSSLCSSQSTPSNSQGEATKKGRKRKQKIEDYLVADVEGFEEELKERIKRQRTEEKTLVPLSKVVESETMKDNFSREFGGEKISDRQPLLVTGGCMRPYQIDGMGWLKGLFEHGINGILADEMGLGKTLQCVGLICMLIQENVIGPFLIAAPLSTLPNWVAEFHRFAPEIRTILYHGSPPEREELRKRMFRVKRYEHDLKSLPVVISSYEILMRDRPHLARLIEWKYLIVDEGHRIKNLNCKLIRELKQYNTANRLLLTGTPLQNNLTELWSLLNFLLPDIFDDLNSFQSWFDFSANGDENWSEKVIAQEKEANVLQTLHAILTPFLLRRLKTDVDLSIPPKKEVLVYAPLTSQQEMFYKTTLDKSIVAILNKKNKPEELLEYTASGRVKRKSTQNIKFVLDYEDEEDFDVEKMIEEAEMQEKLRLQQELDEAQLKKASKKSMVNIKLTNILMQLRKCCNHPYLLEFPMCPETQELIIDERLVSCSGKLLMLDRMLPALKQDGHKVLIFSQMTQMMDILADYCSIRDWSFARLDGTMKFKDRQWQIDEFNADPEVFIFLLSTRAGGLGLNLMAADTCIIYDSDWNPQADLQAQDRCHRIGQTKPVVVYRLVTANTVDQKIVERALAKRRLEKMVIHKKNFKGAGLATAISAQELLELLESVDHSKAVDAANVISDENLHQLLDRTDLQHKSNPEDQKSTEAQDSLTETVEKNQKEFDESKIDDGGKIFEVVQTNTEHSAVLF